MVWLDETEPPLVVGLTVIFTLAEFTAGHSPFFTTARNQVSAVKLPTFAGVKLVEVIMISVGALKSAVAERCHLTTAPVFPLSVRFEAGWLPWQMVWAVAVVPPTLVALTIRLAGSEYTMVQTPL